MPKLIEYEVLVVSPSYKHLYEKFRGVLSRINELELAQYLTIETATLAKIQLSTSEGETLILRGASAKDSYDDKLRGLELTEASCHYETPEKFLELIAHRVGRKPYFIPGYVVSLPGHWKKLLTDLGVYDDLA